MPLNLTALLRERPLLLVGWIFALALAFQFVGRDVIRSLGDAQMTVSPGTLLGRDFVNVYTAGHLMWDGRLGLIYDVAAYRAYQGDLFDGAIFNHNYSYTPVSFLYVWLFAPFPYPISYLLWTALTGAAFVMAARPYLRDVGVPAWAALLVPAAAANIWAGHYGFLFGALLLGAWRMLDDRPRTAGILIGLMIVKPHLALLMPFALARRGAWRAFGYAALTVAALVTVSGLLFGWGYWQTYVTDTLFVQARMIDETGQFYLRMMPTIMPSLLFAGLGLTAAWIVQGLVAVAALAALWRYMPKDSADAGLAVACATFLVLPYAFNYDMTAVGIAALVAMHRTDAATHVGRRLLCVLAFLLPLLIVALNGAGLPLAPLLVAGLLIEMLRPKLAAQAITTDKARPIPQPG